MKISTKFERINLYRTFRNLIHKVIKALIAIKIWIPIVVLLIVLWQVYLIAPSNITDKYTRLDASGLQHFTAGQFTYFYYYKNMYPLISTGDKTKYNVEEANDILQNHKDGLEVNMHNFVTWGEHGRVLLMLLSAYLKGTAKDISIIPVNTILFIITLVSLYLSFEFNNKRYLGLLVVMFLGSNPFELYEIYVNLNIFGFGIIVMGLLLAINLHLIYDRYPKTRMAVLSSTASGAIIGLMTHIRMEFAAPAIGCLLIYATMHKTKPVIKLLIIMVFIAYAFLTTSFLNFYFNSKISEVYSFIKPTDESKARMLINTEKYHTIWHPIWMGFSDFDTKYATKWDDHAAYQMALPSLKEINEKKFSNLFNNQPDLISIQQEYKSFMRSRVLWMIYNDPKWYISIIFQRFNRLFTEVPPIYFRILDYNIEFPMLASLSIILIAYLIYKMDYENLKLMFFAFTVSISSILIHSLRGIVNIAVYHYFAAAILITIFSPKIWNWIFNKKAKN